MMAWSARSNFTFYHFESIFVRDHNEYEEATYERKKNNYKQPNNEEKFINRCLPS